MSDNERREAIAKAVYEAWYTPMRWPENTTMQSRDAGYRAADAVLAALADLENAQVHVSDGPEA
jgi:hypothetical protein